jgi:hypothetical protein
MQRYKGLRKIGVGASKIKVAPVAASRDSNARDSARAIRSSLGLVA